jgi:hypothetical protein
VDSSFDRLTVTARYEDISNGNRKRVVCDFFENVREYLEQLIVVFMFFKPSLSFK